MANPIRGEVQLKAGESTYTLLLNTNAVCALEGKLDMGIADIMAKMGRMSVLRALLWASLLERHTIAKPEDVGPIMDEAGADAVVEAINRAATLAFSKSDAATARKNR